MSLANDEKEVLFALNALVSSNKEREVSFLNTAVLASSENSRPRFASDLKLSAKPSEKDVSATVAAVSPSVSFTMPWPKSLKVSALYVVSALVSKMSRKPLKNPLTPSTVILALLAGGGVDLFYP
nr:hypothetical protein GGHGEOLK_00009 [White spot syndrome virus]WRY70908.1 hypothetical protein OACAMADH_00009 [White spot syndrome virus]